MASTYTSSNGIEMPATGDQNNTWGSTLDNNANIIDQAIDGAVSINLTGVSTYSLAYTNGVVGAGRNKVLYFYGTPSAAVTVTIVNASAQKHWWVINATAQPITFTAGGSNTITIASSYSNPIYCDGLGNIGSLLNNFQAIGNILTGNVTSTGTITSATHNNTGNASVSGTLTVGTLGVSGLTQVQGVTCTNLSAAGTISSTGNATFSGATTNVNALNCTTLSGSGLATLNNVNTNALNATSVYSSGAISSAGNATFSGTTTAVNALTCSTISAGSNVSVGGVLTTSNVNFSASQNISFNGAGFVNYTMGYSWAGGSIVMNNAAETSYIRVGPFIKLRVKVVVTLTGSGTNSPITFSLPANSVSACSLSSVSNYVSGTWVACPAITGEGSINMYVYPGPLANSTYPTGVQIEFIITGDYRVA